MSNTSSRDFSEKLRLIRIAEGLTQRQFVDLVGIGLGTVKNYETHQTIAGGVVVERVLNVPRFQKYTLWLMTDKTAPAAGQISPPLSPDGQDETKSRQQGRNVG
ncbi:helix-turn-helix domain-containing protein [Serratia marcescens]|uniref:helix-turn-helix domain-containing protein n=1 Tax=Serratia marcescens TaxID=615 RepID=UPI000931EC5A|nr:helix-turn-helix transcriptional regulator [Serratia marcescens]